MEITQEGQQAPVPNVSALQTGKLGTDTRKFDLICTGRCEVRNGDLPLKIEGHDIPDLFTIDDDGNAVFAAPQPMATITMPKGHRGLVKVTLTSVKGEDSDESIPKWICLGIRPKDSAEYLDYLHTSTTAEYIITMYSENAAELVPLVSAVDLSVKGNNYTAVEPGTAIGEHSKFLGLTGDIKFGAVYRIDVQNVGEWLTEQDCKFISTWADYHNIGSLGVGPIGNSDEDQIVAMRSCSNLEPFCSSDCINWTDAGMGRVSPGEYEDSAGWRNGLKCGNGVWCAANNDYHGSYKGIRRLANNAWTQTKAIRSWCLQFGEEEKIFMVIERDQCEAYTSEDANGWTKAGALPNVDKSNFPGYSILICGGHKWICGDYEGNLYISENTGKSWDPIDESNLKTTLTNEGEFYGGCYANGYFYVTKTKYIDSAYDGYDSAVVSAIAKSSDGKTWTKVVDNLQGSYHNVTYYKGKLYAFRCDGKKFAVGMP